jgi:hypothetical protein
MRVGRVEQRTEQKEVNKQESKLGHLLQLSVVLGYKASPRERDIINRGTGLVQGDEDIKKDSRRERR